MRAVLALALVIGIAALAWVTFSETGTSGSDPSSPLEDPETDSPDPADAPGSSGSGTSDPPIAPAPREEIPPYPWAEPAWKTAMAKALSRERITVDVRGGTVESVLRVITDQLAWHVDVSELPAERLERSWTVLYEEAEPSRVLQAVANNLQATVHLRPDGIRILPHGVEPDREGDEVFLAGLERAKAVLDAGGPKAAPVTKILPVDFDGVALRKLVPDLGNRLGVDIAIDPRVTRTQALTRVTLRSGRMTAAQVLDDVTAAARLTWAAEERRILVTFEERARSIRDERERARANAAKEVELAVKDRPLHHVADLLGKQIGVPVVVDRELWEPDHPRLTLRAGLAPLRRLLPKLAKAIPARFLVRGEAIYLIPPAGR